jgi:hypothetical protein
VRLGEAMPVAPDDVCLLHCPGGLARQWHIRLIAVYLLTKPPVLSKLPRQVALGGHLRKGMGERSAEN